MNTKSPCRRSLIAEPHDGHPWFSEGHIPTRVFDCDGWLAMPALAAAASTHDSLPLAYQDAAEEALARFAEAFAEYGDSSRDETGLAGQWADLYRKIMKLKAPFWNGEAERLTRETEKVVLQDLIGHALLAIVMIECGKEGGRGAAG